jgi:hypothetical protein
MVRSRDISLISLCDKRITSKGLLHVIVPISFERKVMWHSVDISDGMERGISE